MLSAFDLQIPRGYDVDPRRYIYEEQPYAQHYYQRILHGQVRGYEKQMGRSGELGGCQRVRY